MRFIPLLVVSLVSVSACAKQGNEKQNGSNKGKEDAAPDEVLAQFIGDWKTEVHIKRAAWSTKEQRITGRIKVRWILRKKFVEEVSVGENLKMEHKYLLGYDQKKKTFRAWLFASDGAIIAETGAWNPKTKTMSWTSDLGDGITLREKHRFINADVYVWSGAARDTNGKVYLDMSGKHTRVK